MAKNKNNKNLKISLFNIVLFGALILAIFLAFFTIYKIINSQFKPVVESPKTELKRIPASVKKEFIRQSTLSATLRIPILMYHYVEYVTDKKDTTRQALNINPDVFEEQIKTLREAGFTFITAKELGEILDGKMNVPSNPVVLTFDDGHWDLDTNVLPILRKYNTKATAYIIPGFLGGSDFLNPEQLNDVIKSNLVEIGAHTVHHISLKGKLLPIVNYEVTQSKEMLEKNYHVSVVSFAYPNGEFDQQAINSVRNAGFSTAVSTIPGNFQTNANRFFLFRLRPGYRVGQDLINYISNPSFSTYKF